MEGCLNEEESDKEAQLIHSLSVSLFCKANWPEMLVVCNALEFVHCTGF